MWSELKRQDKQIVDRLKDLIRHEIKKAAFKDSIPGQNLDLD